MELVYDNASWKRGKGEEGGDGRNKNVVGSQDKAKSQS